MPFVALLDANVLWSARLRCTLLRAALQDLYRPAWTHGILRDMADTIKRERPDLDPARIDRTVEQMLRAFPQALVEGYEHLSPVMRNDPDDRHVLAAAVRAGAATIVTWNTKHFPAEARAPYGIDLHTPDEFLIDLWDLNPEAVAYALREQAESLTRPPQTVREVVENLGLIVPRFAATVISSGRIEQG